jgi:hypothetical protein
MNTRTAKSLKPNMALTRESQQSIWRFADALARGLREPAEGEQGDSRWTVSGTANSVWEINHPDFDSLGLEESPLKLRIKQVSPGRWAILTQNNLKNLQSTNTLAVTEEPIQNWNFDELSKAATVYFKEQKQKIDQLKEDLQPEVEPGATTPQPQQDPSGGMGAPDMGGMTGPPPMASRQLRRKASTETTPKEFSNTVTAKTEAGRLKDRYPSLNFAVMKVPNANKYVICLGTIPEKERKSRRASATLQNLQNAEKLAGYLRTKYAGKKWLSGVSVLNDRDGIGVQIRTNVNVKGLPVSASRIAMPILNSKVEKYVIYLPADQTNRALIDLQGVGAENTVPKMTNKSGIMAIYFDATEEEFDKIYDMGAYDIQMAP